MKIGFISSFGEQCGVSEYTKSLSTAFVKQGLDIKIASNYPKSNLYPDPPYVKRLFHTPFLTNQITADVDGLIKYLADRDIIHVQFEMNLYHPSYFIPLMQMLHIKNKPIIFTMHSSGIWSSFDFRLVRCFITHEPMWCSTLVIPMGVKDFGLGENPDYKSIVSFGLGRNNDDIINKCILNTDITFRTTYGHSKWLPLEDLVKEIQKSWIISLYYPQVGANVSSSAVTLAMGCNRPIIVSNTNWFRHVITYSNIYVCDNETDIKNTISYLTDTRNYPKVNEDILLMWEHIVDEGRTFNDNVNRHLECYQKFLKI